MRVAAEELRSALLVDGPMIAVCVLVVIAILVVWLIRRTPR